MKCMKKLFSLLLAVVILTAGISSCKKSSEIDNGNGNVDDGSVKVGNVAPGFTEKDTGNNDFSLESLRGKVILLSFSTMWCGPCQLEASQLGNLYFQYKERGLEIVQVIPEDEGGDGADMTDINRWADKYILTFTVVSDPDFSSTDVYTQGAFPTNVIIDRNFVIRYWGEGFDHDTIIQKIEQYL